jgi:surface antigen
MNNHSKTSAVLASVMTMILAIPGSAWADGGRVGNDWNKGVKGNQKHSSGHYNNHYNNYYKGNYRAYYKGRPYYYPKYYGCNNCNKNKSHHNNNNSNDKLWIGLLGGGILGYALGNVIQNNTQDDVYSSQPVATPPLNVDRYDAPYGDNTCLQEREYQTKIMVGGKQVDGYGTACLQPDGSWRYGTAQAESY